MNQIPTHETHIAVTMELPVEPNDSQAERPYIAPPNLWQNGVKCTHKLSGQKAVCARIDLGTMQFRPFWPDTQTFGSRTEWLACADWQPEVTLSEKEIARQAAAKQLEDEMAALDADDLANVTALVDGDDPAKALAKINALRNMKVIKGSSVAIQAAAKKGR